MGPSEGQGNVEEVPSLPYIAAGALIDDFLIYKGTSNQRSYPKKGKSLERQCGVSREEGSSAPQTLAVSRSGCGLHCHACPKERSLRYLGEGEWSVNGRMPRN